MCFWYLLKILVLITKEFRMQSVTWDFVSGATNPLHTSTKQVLNVITVLSLCLEE
jgi:hypothetical protein